MLVGCEERKYECTDVLENHDVECCGVKDPLNNIKWLNEIHLQQKSQFFYNKVEILCLKYENKTTKEHSILFYKNKVYPNSVKAYSCYGKKYFGGSLDSSLDYVDIFDKSVTRSSEPMAPHIYVDSNIWNAFVQENVLIDTLAIYTYN
jgi:hypothetical protein